MRLDDAKNPDLSLELLPVGEVDILMAWRPTDEDEQESMDSTFPKKIKYNILCAQSDVLK